MHQIDIMVENKRLEWEQQLKTLQIQCERKERDIQKLRETIEHRNKEVSISNAVKSNGQSLGISRTKTLPSPERGLVLGF